MNSGRLRNAYARGGDCLRQAFIIHSAFRFRAEPLSSLRLDLCTDDGSRHYITASICRTFGTPSRGCRAGRLGVS
jgi:hypothetical protein